MLEIAEKELLHDDEMALCVRTIAALALDQDDEIRSSLAWMIRNRIEMLRAARGRAAVATACDAVLREARAKNGVLPRHPDIPRSEWQRIRSANERVWQGKVADSTQGATACHRHDENPGWARQRTPTALLGEYLFFR
jgi:hypothetical protein